MDMFVVQGGYPLRGRVPVCGAKNAALPIMAAALAIDGTVVLHRIPHLADVQTLSQLLQLLGLQIQLLPNQGMQLELTDTQPYLAPYELVRKMRASICVLGPLLARRGRACVSLPGGCNIGHRPIDLHLKGLAALGAEISLERGYVHASARRLRGASIDLCGPSGSTVTGTCNVMTAACLAKGVTHITSAATEPEVVDLGHFLNAAGAQIDGLGTSHLTITGVSELHSVEHTIIPDRIEAGTLMMAAAITRGELQLVGTCGEHLTQVMTTLRQMGVNIDSHGDGLTVSCEQRLRPIDVTTGPYPAFPTDLQAQLMALLSLADGSSRLIDSVFPDRFLHIPELCRLGADIRREGAGGVISGVSQLSGASVMASDLRASAALLLAALAASGDSVIRRIYHLDRGYESLENKLKPVGARIERVVDTIENTPRSLLPLSEALPPAPKFLSHPKETTSRSTSLVGEQEGGLDFDGDVAGE
ncbi:UDP-N-acetylglucosamine 1-carboxyvinyltransferase [bacterium]|nr:UDP-N-acetylglucosamine 1-carboxyvinyltransferase [bacterium]